MAAITKTKQAGFTLIEVLIAAMIMFSVLATAALAFKNASQNSAQAEKNIQLLAPLALIKDHIVSKLNPMEDQQLAGSGQVLGVEFAWQAEVLVHAAPVGSYNIDLGSFVEYEPRFLVYQVKLELSYDGLKRQQQYKELLWQDIRVQ